MSGLPWRRAPGGIILAVRVTPRAARTGLDGLWHDADGQAWAAIRVQAAPSDGAANDALIRFVAVHFGVAPRAVGVASGTASRLKRLHIDGDPDSLERIARHSFSEAP